MGGCGGHEGEGTNTCGGVYAGSRPQGDRDEPKTRGLDTAEAMLQAA